MEKIKKVEVNRKSWFWRWFLNNQVVSSLLIVLLILLIVLISTKVSHLFEPVWQFFAIVGFPVIFSGILFYLFNPIVDRLEKKGLKRVWGISFIFIAVLFLLIWGGVTLVPKMEEQTMSFIKSWPHYWSTIQTKGNEILSHPFLEQYADDIEKITNNFFDSMGTMIKSLSINTFQGIGSVIGAFTTVFLTIATAPIILFYLLKDGKELGPYLVHFLPAKTRRPVYNVLKDVNKQVSQYIRGQLTVALAVAIMFMIGFKIVGLEYSVTLGIFAGFMNLIPYLGSFLAMIPAVLIALATSPKMLVAVLIVFALEQFIEGRFVSPLVLGSQLDIHPVTIIFVLLTAGKLFGVVGVILGVPGYAAIKVVVTHIFEWYKAYSGLYPAEEVSQEYVEMQEEPLE